MTPSRARSLAAISRWWRRCRGQAAQLSAGFSLLCLLITAFPETTMSDFEGQPRYSKQEIHRAISYYAKRYRLDPALLRAVIKVESDFRPHVVSRKGAVGLMQLTPDTAATLRVADIHDPIQNIRGGAKQLRRLLNLYKGNLSLTLAAYNAGINRVKGRHVPRIRETRVYVRKVLKYYRRYQPHQSPAIVDSRKGAEIGSIILSPSSESLAVAHAERA
ncbi:MAG: transglycosylase SLT domain-containing protein [Nitrospira sp. CR1.3]|nr:transglycosylase SLT domain-containing protein [Nitrospira sp. CR1.3]